jgi:2',3'-cyclic-nucleotide 2'-phosphodiesterase/3'-nucleotidase
MPSRLRHPTRRDVVTAAAALGLGALAKPWAPVLAAGTAQLRLLETSDVHVHLLPYDYYRDREDASVGLARIATLVARARAEVANCLLLDNGDFLQGNPLGDWMAYERGLAPGEVHPVMAAMNAMGFDAATLGNHEFNYGLSFLEKALAGARFPFVLANLARGRLASRAGADRTFLPPWVILERELVDGAGLRHPIRIGLLGFTPPQIMIWDKAHLSGNVEARDIVETARARVPELREAGADLVVALSHSGIAAVPPEGAENASLHLGGIDGIDVILTGHQHRLFPGETYQGLAGADAARGTIAGKPAVMPNFWGSHLGVVDLVLTRDGRGWRVVDSRVENRPIFERVDRQIRPLVEPDPAIVQGVEAAHRATLAYVRRPVGQSRGPITSYWALLADDPSVQIVSNAQIWYVRRMLAGGPYADLPVLSAAAPFKAGGRGGPDYYTDVPAGPLAIKNVADLYLYPNTVRAVLVDGAGVKEWLERSAGIFNRIDPVGGDQPLIDARFPSFNFDILDGVTYAIDVTRPARYDAAGRLVDPTAERIVDLRFAGRPIDPRQRFVVATNNYRAAGGGSFPGLDGSNVILEAPDTNRDAIVRYIQESGAIDPAADGNWRLAPTTGGARLVIETGPGARAHLASAPLPLEELGGTPEGFLRFGFRLG